MRLGAVLDHCESVPRRDLVESVHVHRMSEEVHGNDRARARRDERLEEVEVEVPRDRLRVDRDGHVTVVVRGERRRDVRARADEDLRAGLQIQRSDCKVERGRPAGHSDAVPYAYVVGELALE